MILLASEINTFEIVTRVWDLKFNSKTTSCCVINKNYIDIVAIIKLLSVFKISWSVSFNVTKRNLLLFHQKKKKLLWNLLSLQQYGDEVLDILRRERLRDAATSFHTVA